MFGAPLALSMNAFAGTEIKLSTQTISTASPVRQKDFSVSNTEWIVQFKNHITEVDKKNLNSNGFKVYAYIPEDALIVRGSAAGLQILNKNANVQAVIPYAASMKISPSVGALSSMLTETRQTFIVSLFEASDLKVVATALKNISKNIILNLSSSNSLVVTASRGDLTKIATLPSVENIQPYFQVEPLKSILTAEDVQDTPKGPGDYSDINGFETGTKVMNFDAAWALGLHGENQIVGMADTGLDSGNAAAIHRDFTGAVKSGYAVGLFGKSWSDPMGHGTHVAGSVLGRGTASGGLLHGGAYAAQIVVQGIWSPMLNNLSVPADLGKMFGQAYADGARVHTNSWGSAASFGSYDKMAATVDQVMFEKQDMLILFAAGNSGVDKNKDGRIDPNSIGSPGTAKNALTVGASENLVSNGGNQKKVGELSSSKDNWPVAPITLSTMSDNVNGLAMFSSRGPTADGRTKPEIVAPGTNILSVHSQQPGVEPLWGLYNNDYAWSGGTSMATPLTAGAAAVTRQYLLKSFAKPSAALVKAYIVHNATEMFPGQYGAIGTAAGQEIITLRPNSDEGFGLVNMAKIVNPVGMQLMVDNTDGVGTGAVSESKLSLSTGGHLMVTLVWTDAPGSTTAAKALVNDLDLEVVLPNGQVLAVNDAINNHAFVQGDVAAGDITVRVKGVNVPMGINGKQPFAVVASVQ
ncbi:MAG: S8 family serine peptidase [Bdellovibrio sp.]|nr:S8 family serine peptidase [Bdellovibrio sp.]